MADRIQIRRDTAASWTSANPTLAQGELGAETDTLKVKMGDGSTAWSSLSYLIDAGDYLTTTGTQTASNKTLVDPAIEGAIKDEVFTITDGAAFEIDPSNGAIQLITLGASRTPKATNFAAGEAITLMVDDGTAYAITWTDATFGGSGVVWKTETGTAPTLNTTGYTAIVLWKVSTQVYGARVGDA